MKKIFSVILFCALSLICHSQNINPAIQLKDGGVVDKSHAFLDGETPTKSVCYRDSDEICDFCHSTNLSKFNILGVARGKFVITDSLFNSKK
jgi:hypothetical protein